MPRPHGVARRRQCPVQALRSGELDVALLALPIHDEQLTSISLFDDPFLLAVPEDHAFAKYQRITQAMLEEQQLLLLEEGHCLRDQALSVCNMLGSQESQDFRATSLETLRQMVIGGVGITLMPQIACHPQNGIRYIPLAKPAPKRTIGMVWRKQSARVECLQTILELLKK